MLSGWEHDHWVQVQCTRGCPRCIIVNAQDHRIVVREFAFQSRLLSDKHAWETHEPSYPLIYGLNSTTTVLLKKEDGFGIK